MKHLFTLGLLIGMSHMALSQDHKNDASYSKHNYKHPNKAAFAEKNDLDNAVEVKSSTGKANDNYKQKFNKPKETEKSMVKVETKKDTKNKSYKHPYGL